MSIKKVCKVFGCNRKTRSGGRECGMHFTRRWRLENPEKSAFGHLRSSAKKRGIEFKLSFDEFVSFISTTEYLAKKGRDSDALHIDRVEEKKGYVLGNLQILTAAQNAEKENIRRKTARRGREVYVPPVVRNEFMDAGEPF